MTEEEIKAIIRQEMPEILQDEVFGRPEQIELDLLVKNGLLIICEIKSSMSKPDIYIFEKKVQFYQQRLVFREPFC